MERRSSLSGRHFVRRGTVINRNLGRRLKQLEGRLAASEFQMRIVIRFIDARTMAVTNTLVCENGHQTWQFPPDRECDSSGQETSYEGMGGALMSGNVLK